jgi:hypothetical protein
MIFRPCAECHSSGLFGRVSNWFCVAAAGHCGAAKRGFKRRVSVVLIPPGDYYQKTPAVRPGTITPFQREEERLSSETNLNTSTSIAIRREELPLILDSQRTGV